MDLQDQINQATAEFQGRQLRWSEFAAYDLQSLERVVRYCTLTAAEHLALSEYIAHRRAVLRDQQEAILLRAERIARIALPIVVTVFSAFVWLLTQFNVHPPLTLWLQAVMFLACTVLWACVQYVTYRATQDAKRELARLDRAC